jgi:protein-S-isoprenylcysteine O-methyltransferase Ste14
MDNHAKGRLLVTLQFLLLGGLVLISSEDIFWGNSVVDFIGLGLEIIGFVVVLIGFRGLGKSLTANPVPIKSGKLVTTGIYSRVRHPIYLGLILVSFGIVLTNGSVIKFGFWILLVALLIFKMKFEESLLVKTYPGYKQYQEKVPGIFPKFTA